MIESNLLIVIEKVPMFIYLFSIVIFWSDK